MNQEVLTLIKTECEKIEKSGFGKVLISIENGYVKMIQPTPTIRLEGKKRNTLYNASLE